MIQRAAMFALALLATPAPVLAEIRFVDDRSSPVAVLRSLYNAINLHETTRAYAYWNGSTEVPDFATFAKGYATTAHVELLLGVPVSDGAAGSIYFNVPAAIRATDAGGGVHEFAGCYVLRQIDPTLQAVRPFRPIFIVSGHLKPVTGLLQAALPKGCGG